MSEIAVLSKQLYLQPYMNTINENHQITHVCVPRMVSWNSLTEEFIEHVKIKYLLQITVVPFNPILFEDLHDGSFWCKPSNTDNLTDGLYILVDTNNEFNVMKYIGQIQREINKYIDQYKITNDIQPSLTSWCLHYLSDRRHKWVGG